MTGERRFSLLGSLLALLLALSLMLGGCTPRLPANGNGSGDEITGDVDTGGGSNDEGEGEGNEGDELPDGIITLDSIPEWDGETAYVPINDNIPFFEPSEYTSESFETYAELDALGRCGVTYACIGRDIMPTEEREDLYVKPSGWVNNKYDSSVVPGGYIYNRCHLIGFQLTGENNNKQNLITGTQFINIEGMLPFENMVADYVKEYGNHVLYRVTPIFEGYNLVASGVLLEAYSVEDGGEGICFCVYAYNVQPGVYINYYDGTNRLATADDPLGGGAEGGETPDDSGEATVYILNISSKKIHTEDCRYASSMKEENRKEHTGSLDELLSDGYTKCNTCNPS